MLKTREQRNAIYKHIRAPIKDYPCPEHFPKDPPVTLAMQAEARAALIEVRKRIEKAIPDLEVYAYVVPAGTPSQGGRPHLLNEWCDPYAYLSHMYDLHKALKAKDWYWACRRLQEVVGLHQVYDLRTAVALYQMLGDALNG